MKLGAPSRFGPLVEASDVIPVREPSSWHYTDALDVKTIVILGLAAALAWDRGLGRMLASKFRSLK